MVQDLSPKALEIVACARRLLAERGYNGFSYADIAEAVGISKPSVHHHFASKAALVRHVTADYRLEAATQLAALSERVPEPLARLETWIGFWQACLRERTLSFCVCAMLATEMPAIPAEVGTQVRGHFDDLSDWLVDVLALGAAQGTLRLNAAPAMEASALIAGIHGAMVSARAYDDPALFARLTHAMLHRLTGAD